MTKELILTDSPDNNHKFEVVPEGTHNAVCVGVWDIGKQTKTWNNETKVVPQIVIAWEIDKTIDDKESQYHGKRMMVTEKYNAFLGDKANLRKLLNTWIGVKPDAEGRVSLDVMGLVGVPCLLTVTHKPKNSGDGVWVNVASAAPLMNGMEALSPERDPSDDPPKWVQEKIDNQIHGDSAAKSEYANQHRASEYWSTVYSPAFKFNEQEAREHLAQCGNDFAAAIDGLKESATQF